MVDEFKNIRKFHFPLDRYDNEPYSKNPLMKYRSSRIKRKREIAAIKRRAIIERNKYFREPVPPESRDDSDSLPESYYIQQIRDAVASAPVPKMLDRMRRKIINFVPKPSVDKHSAIVNEYMNEVSEHYNETIRTFNVRRFLVPQKDDPVEDVVQPFKFKHAGRTAHYKRFLLYRKKLKENLFIPYPFIRYILHLSNQRFPSVLNDYGNYKKTKSGICVWLLLVEFETSAQRDLEHNAIFLKEEWYPKIVQVLLKHYRKRTLPPTMWPRVLNCAKGLINRQITELKVDTFEHIFKVLSNRAKMPPIKFQAACTSGRIALYPSFRELSSTYRRIFKSIAAIATKFPPLEPLIDRTAFTAAENYLKIEIGDIFFEHLLARLEKAVEVAYAPILEYIDQLQDEYYDLYSEETKEEMSSFLAETRPIDEYFDKIATFRVYIEKIQKTVQNQAFDNGMVNQSKALSGLRTIAQDYINEITQKIVGEHKRDCQRICDWFANVQKRALEAPKSTETLLANGEFMLQVKNKKINEIREHIQNNLKISGRLIDLTDFDEEYKNLQISPVHWLYKIQDIFEQNSSQFEIYKNQFEEHLTTVTKKLTQDIDDLVPKLAIIDDMYDTNKLRNYFATLEIYKEQLKCFEDYIKWINKEEKLFKLPVSQYPILDELKNYVDPFADLIKLCIEWLRYYYIWMDGPFEYLKPPTIESLVQNNLVEFEKTQKYYKNRIKQDMLGNPTLKFRGQTEDPDPDKHPVPLRLCNKMIDWINGFQIGVYIVKIMCNPALRDRHWVEMSEIAGFNLTPDAGTSLRKITKFGIDHLLPSFEIISIGANKELQLQMDLADMLEEWESIEFPINVYKDTEIKILGNIEDIQVLLDDHIIKTLTMRGSAFVKPCEQEVRNWYEKLLRVSRIFEEWMKVQTNWLYLLPILSSEDILIEMPEEERLFTCVNQVYCKYINMAIADPIVMQMTSAEGFLEELISANEMLDEIKSGVNAYLERKRLYFPRFFFLSNNEMLQILSETKNPQNVQPFLCKCFDGIDRLQMDADGSIDAMLSIMKEKINFMQKIPITTGGSVEKWLLSVEKEMYAAVRNEIINGYADYVTTDRIDWALNWAEIVVLVIANIFWTSDVHTCLLKQDRDLLMNVYKEIQQNLEEVTEAIRSNEVTNLNRITLKSLCILDVHMKEITEKLVNDKNSSINDFQWIAQLRYYWIDQDIIIKILNAKVSFGYEYLGNFQRVVMTPLTERCYRSVLLAYQHKLNASIEGPTATGKSETIKDMAKALAIQLKVFDCSADLDYRSIGKFLKGTALSGAWLCFEDFNRIKLKTLSVVTQQIQSIQMAKRKQLKSFRFDGIDIKLNESCNVCIMLNPRYKTRSKLPDNLKILFRPISMMKPDTEHITEVSLYSSGFRDAKVLAKKVMTLYKICSELLSAQDLYDFGLRNLKIALRLCASRMQTRLETDPESKLVYQSLLDVNLPKLSPTDMPTFISIIEDLFPGLSPDGKSYDWLRETFELQCKDRNFQPVNALFTKVVETYEMMSVRQGLMLIGNPYTGKSFVLSVLANALIASKRVDAADVDCAFVNPKAIDLKHLFGEYDPINMEWIDGVVSSIFRRFVDERSDKTLKWLVFDGPIESQWIESLNTVLDDNRKLCLVSGEVLNLRANTSVIFEVNSMNEASPSTVSRMGIVYFPPDILEWQTLAKSWMNTCSKKWINDCKSFLWDLFGWIFPPMIEYVTKHGVHLMNPLKHNLIQTTLDILQMVIDEAIDTNQTDDQKFLLSWVQAAAMYSISWGIGGILDEPSRQKFDQFHRKIWSCTEEHPPPMSIKSRMDISIPAEGLLIDYFYVFKQKGSFKPWVDLVRRQDPEFHQHGVQVATIDSARYSQLIEMHIKHGKNVLLVGPPATGKTHLIKNVLLNKINLEKFSPNFITFNTRTKANDVHEDVLSKLIKLKRGVYGPPKGMTCALFVDDLNIPVNEACESHSSTEILRQIYDYGYVYDLKNNGKINVESILTLAACGAPGGRYNTVDIRFLNHFNCFSINEFSEETLNRIYSGILMNGYKKTGHAADVLGNVNQIVTATMQVYSQIIRQLKPTPKKCHYRFDMRDILQICTGCSLLRKESVENKKIFAKIWFHESLRVFHDRLIEADEKNWLFEKLSEQINDTNGTFKDSMEIVFETHTNEEGIVTLDSIKNQIFGSYLDIETDVPNRKYEEVANLDKLAELATAALNEYNETAKFKLNVILFTYAVEHLNRICRIISMPGGNGLILGIGDSGRKSLVRLATILCKQSLFQLRIEQNYNVKSWKEDIKNALKSAGGLGQQTVLLLSENQLSHDAFFTDIDYMLNSGDVPNLWPIDEKQELLEMVRLVAQGGNRNIDISAAEVFSFFVNRCRQNLHIVLSFNLFGPKLRNYIRLYPSFINCCTVDVFDEWPEMALEMVATKFITNFEFSEKLNGALLASCKYLHATARDVTMEFSRETKNEVSVTTASYLELVRCFSKLFEQKRNEITETKSKYVSGLDTLQRAALAVENMQKELNELQPKLLAMAENCRQMTSEIETKTIEASVATEQVKRDELVANGQAAAAEAMEDECSKDLAQAVPVLEDALQALNTLKPADITLVKSMKNPPSAVKLVMAAVCVMKAVPPDRVNDAASGKKIIDYWSPSKRILGDMGFLQSLKDYDKDDISPEIMKKIRKDFIPHKDFQPHVVAKASSAAEGLCKWIKAIENFESVNSVVLPKKFKLMKAKENLKETRRFLAEKRFLAALLEEKVAGLNAELEKTNIEKARTEREVKMCEQKLKRAEALINSLGQEKSHWTHNVATLENLLDSLPGDIMISAGLMAYLGRLSKYYRDKCISKWFHFCRTNEIPCSERYSLVKCLGSEAEIQYWSIFGLSTDESSIENAIVMSHSFRQCIFVDPQRQANKWIRNMEKSNQLEVVKVTDAEYFKKLLDCMKSGRPILIEDIVDHLDISLEPIFNYRITQQEGFIQLHSHLTAKISSKFRLYATTNARNLQFLSAFSGKLNIINFAFASQGLEENLLDIVVLKENPYLREDRDQLLQDKARDQALLVQYEDAILSVIAESEGDILENEMAIKKMDDTKQLCAQIIEKQLVYVESEHKIEDFRESYRPVASYAATLYATLNQLQNIQPMYQFSLDWYLDLYNSSIENANRSRELNRRIDFLIKSITNRFYNSVSRSIFNEDNLLFSWIITSKILVVNGRLKNEQLTFFISPHHRIIGPEKEKPDGDWITDKTWQSLHAFAEILDDVDLISAIQEDPKIWKAYFDDASVGIPTAIRTRLTAFEQLIIVKIFHPEDIIEAVTNFIVTEMSEQFTNPPNFDIHKSFEESNMLTPLIFILSPSIDPIDTLCLFAERLGYSQSLQIFSLGANQDKYLEHAISQAQQQGSWICLQNCHLDTAWLTNLENVWKNMNIYNTTSSFRLWITTETTDTFPLNLLQNGVKITYEKPDGLKANLLNLYKSDPLNSNFYNSCPQQDKTFKKLLYSHCYFDTIVNERKKYEYVGWNTPYDFNKSDFVQSIQQLQMFLSNGNHVPYDTFKYIIGTCFYGGRVTDEYDQRLLETILDDYLNEGVVNDPLYQLTSNAAYTLPRRFEHRMIIQYIDETISMGSHCELYGLHSNSDFAYRLKTSNSLLSSMAISVNVEQQTQDESLEENDLLNKLHNIIEKLPTPLVLDTTTRRKTSSLRKDSLNSVLLCEMEKYNKLLMQIRRSCDQLQRAIKGEFEMTPSLESICKAITDNEIPEEWIKCSYPSVKYFSSYVNDFIERFRWLERWWLNDEAPKTYWLSAFFRPRGFLAAIKLNYARIHDETLDKLTFDFHVPRDLSTDAFERDGVLVDGLYLEAAHWNGSSIVEQLPLATAQAFPAVQIECILAEHFKESCRYKCPVYYMPPLSELSAEHSTQQQFVCAFWLPIESGVSPVRWIKRGVALNCQIID